MTNSACRYALRRSDTLLCVRILSHLVLGMRIAQSKYYAHNFYLQKVINNVSNQFGAQQNLHWQSNLSWQLPKIDYNEINKIKLCLTVHSCYLVLAIYCWCKMKSQANNRNTEGCHAIIHIHFCHILLHSDANCTAIRTSDMSAS